MNVLKKRLASITLAAILLTVSMANAANFKEDIYGDLILDEDGYAQVVSMSTYAVFDTVNRESTTLRVWDYCKADFKGDPIQLLNCMPENTRSLEETEGETLFFNPNGDIFTSPDGKTTSIMQNPNRTLEIGVTQNAKLNVNYSPDNFSGVDWIYIYNTGTVPAQIAKGYIRSADVYYPWGKLGNKKDAYNTETFNDISISLKIGGIEATNDPGTKLFFSDFKVDTFPIIQPGETLALKIEYEGVVNFDPLKIYETEISGSAMPNRYIYFEFIPAN